MNSGKRRNDAGNPPRHSLGRASDDARFTVPARRGELPAGYGDMLAELKQLLQTARLRTVLSANAALVRAYWDIGRTILARQKNDGWGAKVIDRLSADLRETFPDMQGLSPRNLKYMRAFAAAWPDASIVQGPLAQIGWYQNIALLERIADPSVRLWYAQQAAASGWSQPILCLQIENRLHERQGRAANNFALTLPPVDSDLAAQIFKDPYLFDFLGTADPRREREVEQALIDHIQRFLLELGNGFAFVGRQMHLEVGNQDFYLDLLFYHFKLRCFIIVELKARAFEPGDVGQMNLYLSAVDDLLRHPDDKPTIGLLLCKEKDHIVAEYALRDVRKPIGVAGWQTKLLKSLPPDIRSSLPTVKEMERELTRLTASLARPRRRSRK